MVFKIDYYPDSVAGAFGKPAGGKGVCSCHMPGLEKIAGLISNKPGVSIHQKPYHLSLEANSPRELSDLAFQLSEQLAKAGFPYYSLPFDYSQFEEVN